MCGGKGRDRVDDGWGSYDLEACSECHGDGITDTCDRCQLLMDMDYEDEERRAGNA